MHHAKPFLLLLIVAVFAAACQSDPSRNGAQPSQATQASTDDATAQGDRPIAYLDGKIVTQSQLYRQVVHAHGGEALAEILLDRAVDARLMQEGFKLTPADIDAERQTLLASMDPDPDQAARLLREMREQRGLDEKRFARLLRRNAGLRLLVRDEVTINEIAIKQAYDLRYGKTYQVRLIVTAQLDELTGARKRVLAGESFTGVAIALSSDSSARQGGLLSPISPADPTYPKVIRDALPKLKMESTKSRLSPTIALDQGYAMLWLEEILTPSDPPSLDVVRDQLTLETRSGLERVRMRQLARTLIEQGDVVILDPALNESWRRQRGTTQKP